MKKFLVWIFVAGYLSVSAQDTLSILQYNLLNYGNYTDYCTSNNNKYTTKDTYIKTIVQYVKPDIFSVNEVSASHSIQQHLLDYALNTDGVNYFAMAPSLSSQDDYLVNMLYYNTEKLGLAGHVIAQTYIRDVDVYKLYYKSGSLNSGGDTAFLYCVVAHLKSSTNYEDQRKIMAKNTMDYIASHHPDNNYLLMGDFNLYSDREPAFQEFVDYSDASIRFSDPANQIGEWHNNADFSMVHTQSTHDGNNGCAASGGMDDRFDFILMSNNIKNNLKKMQYISGSYHVVGQDGKHFNTSINASPTNTSVPSQVLNALYRNSDHLPVSMKLLVDEPLGVQQLQASVFNAIHFTNPVKNMLRLRLEMSASTSYNIEIYSLLGQIRWKKQGMLNRGQHLMEINLSTLSNGVYIIRFVDGSGHSQSRKLLKR